MGDLFYQGAPAGGQEPGERALLAALERLGRDELAARAEDSRRILAEHGVSCFVDRNGAGSEEMWQLDLMPLVIGAAEWRELESGLLQRARLLNLVLADLYGTQRLVRDGLAPAALVYANPGYLRPCQAIHVPGGAYLHVYAADLARSPDGGWRVLADRTQAPAGVGFALENRSVLARVLPEAVREVQPRPLAGMLRVRRDTLRQFAPPDAPNPSLALLTPGPRNEAYFEHAYLARLLGLTLVEGDDLTVRDRRLFVKTLDGLRRADVLLRRVSDAFCDPLELRGDSLLGVPGLVEAARAGRVSVGNALGSGLLESPAFLPFLPGLCRHVLGEELRLHSAPTWWCGQAREQAYVREHLENLVVRSAFSLAGAGVRPSTLDAAGRAELLGQLCLRPHEFAAQEEVRLSRALSGTGRESALRPYVARMFVLQDGAGLTVMPGGLARVTREEQMASAALPFTSLSKDVWVMPDGAAAGSAVQALSAPQPAHERAPSDLPSRAADNFFWLGRYAERLEQIVRVSRYVLRGAGEDSGMGNPARVAVLGALLARLGFVEPAIVPGGGREPLQTEVLHLLFEEGRAAGARDLLNRIHLAAFSVRDRLSADTWRILNRLEPDARQRPGRLPAVQASAMLHTLVLDLAAFSGMEMENMTRGHGWAFLDIGRRIERGAFMARLLEAVLRIGDRPELLLEPALEIGDSAMTHRRRYFAEPRLESAFEVLALDPANPRSLAFQLAALETHAAALPAGANPEGAAAVRDCARQLAQGLPIPAQGGPGWPAEVEALAGLDGGLIGLSDLLTQVYFSHVAPRVN